jgi:hypothetical protein
MAIPSGKMQNADFYNDAAGCRVTLMGISAEYGPDLFPAPTTRGFAGLFIQIMPVFGNCASPWSCRWQGCQDCCRALQSDSPGNCSYCFLSDFESELPS